MHVPAKESMDKAQTVHQFIKDHGFALLISPSLFATHVPLYLIPEEGKLGTLYGQIAKANYHSDFKQGEAVLVVFSGPHSYISPTWYASPVAVPTWNYASVHCHGVIEKLNEVDTLNQVKQLIAQYEPELLDDNKRRPETYQQRLLKGIIGFKVSINHIEAREKLGQHKSVLDQSGVFSALKQSKHDDAVLLAMYMDKRNLGTGGR